MISLSDLIYGSQNSDDKINGQLEQTEQVSSQINEDHASPLESTLRSTYDYDAIEDYYNGNSSKIGVSSNKRRGTQQDRNHKNGDDPPDDKKRRKYDFQRNEDERKFYDLTGLDDANRTNNVRKRRRRKRQRVEGTNTFIYKYIDSETQEEEEARLRENKERSKRRNRFRRVKKNEYKTEEDYGNAVDFLLRQKMNVADLNGKQNEVDSAIMNKEVKDDDLIGIEDKSSKEHVLGSLIDRVVSQNSVQGGKVVKEETQNSMHFVQEGYAAPQRSDPNFSYSNRMGLSSIGANKLFIQHFEAKAKAIVTRIERGELNGKDFRVFPKQGKEINVKLNPWTCDTPVYDQKLLPLSCFNPTVTRSRVKNIDTFHYFPALNKPTSLLRINTAKDHSFLSALVNCNKKRYRFASERRFSTKDFHSRNITRIAARAIFGRRILDISRLLELLHRKKPESSRVRVIQKFSEEMARNWIFWQGIKPKVQALCDRYQLNDKFYASVKNQLLSADADILANPNLGTDLISKGAMMRRESLHTTVSDLTEATLPPMKSCVEESTRKRTNEINSQALKIDKSNDINKQVRTKELLKDGMENPKQDLPSQTKSFEERTSKVSPSIKIEYESDSIQLGAQENPIRVKAEKQNSKNINLSINKTPQDVKSITESTLTHLDKKYSDVEHISDLDPVNITITIGALLSELSSERVKLILKGFDEDCFVSSITLFESIHTQIMSYLDRAIDTIFYRGVSTRTISLDGKNINAPLVQSILLRQSYVANSGAFGMLDREPKFQSYNSSDDDQETEDENRNNVSGSTFNNNIVICAKELAQFGSRFEANYRVETITEINITTGIAIIAAVLPPYAAEIISRPFSSSNCEIRTPFDLMRLTLEEIEKKGDISRKGICSTFSHQTVSDNDIIEALDNASNLFQRCLETDPRNLDCACWHVASRLGVVCISSGILIGNGVALAAPSEYENDIIGVSLSNSGQRARHRDYGIQRASASEAIRKLLSLDTGMNAMSSRHHMAVISFLEWREAVFLLAFRPHLDQSVCKRICQLHTSHVFHWARKECTASSYNRLMLLYQKKQISHKHIIQFVATMVEYDGSNSRLWMDLACALGSVGKYGEERCKNRNCLECSRLQKGRFIDHKYTKREKKDKEWWGKLPSKWWDSTFLTFPLSLMSKPKRSVVNAVRKKIKEHLASVDDYHSEKVILLDEPSDIKNSTVMKDVSWLWSTEASDSDKEDQLSDTVNASDGNVTSNLTEVSFDQLLPELENSNIFHEVFAKSKRPPISDIKESDLISIIVARVIVVSHLYTVCDPYIENAVWWLTRRCCRVKKKDKDLKTLPYVVEDCDEFKSLIWLSGKGINVSTILKIQGTKERRRILRNKKISQQLKGKFEFALI